MTENKFKIIVPFYNVEKWITYCVRSVKAQKYENYECILIDDISTDKTPEIIKKEIEGNDKFRLIKNTEKKYALKNIHDTLNLINPDEKDIIVILDGDDWLSSADVLSKLNDIYNLEDCWMTFGSYVEYPKNIRGKFAKKISDDVVDNNLFRESDWMSSHLRTFRYKLWEKINKQDFVFSETEKYYKAAWDLAFVFPMLEMAGGKAKYVEDVLYVYNRSNPLNEDKINHNVQLTEEQEVRKKQKYSLLEDLL
jgi:glycosyltransferase involved in cell wall biosynthesis